MSRLTVELASPAAPAEIRDAKLRLVATLASGEGVELAPGRYVASVSLPGGGDDTRTVRVHEGDDDVSVRLGREFEPEDRERFRLAPRPVEVQPPRKPREPRRRPSERRVPDVSEIEVIANKLLRLAHEEPADRWHVRFVSADGRHFRIPPAVLAAPRDDGRQGAELIVQTEGFDTPRFAQLATRGATPLNVALPLAPGNECQLLVQRGRDDLRATAAPLGNSPLAANVGRYLAAGQVREAALVTGAAELMLQAKIQDPIGAAMGGYALLRLGDFSRLHDWPTNLTHYFPWLPDGPVIAGELAAQSGDDQTARGFFELALERGCPIFSAGITLLATRAPQLGLSGARVRQMGTIARFAGIGRLTVTLHSFDPLRPAASQRPRWNFGAGHGWIAFRGAEPEVN